MVDAFYSCYNLAELFFIILKWNFDDRKVLINYLGIDFSHLSTHLKKSYTWAVEKHQNVFQVHIELIKIILREDWCTACQYPTGWLASSHWWTWLDVCVGEAVAENVFII